MMLNLSSISLTTRDESTSLSVFLISSVLLPLYLNINGSCTAGYLDLAVLLIVSLEG